MSIYSCINTFLIHSFRLGKFWGKFFGVVRGRLEVPELKTSPKTQQYKSNSEKPGWISCQNNTTIQTEQHRGLFAARALV